MKQRQAEHFFKTFFIIKVNHIKGDKYNGCDNTNEEIKITDESVAEICNYDPKTKTELEKEKKKSLESSKLKN